MQPQHAKVEFFTSCISLVNLSGAFTPQSHGHVGLVDIPHLHDDPNEERPVFARSSSGQMPQTRIAFVRSTLAKHIMPCSNDGGLELD